MEPSTCSHFCHSCQVGSANGWFGIRRAEEDDLRMASRLIGAVPGVVAVRTRQPAGRAARLARLALWVRRAVVCRPLRRCNGLQRRLLGLRFRVTFRYPAARASRAGTGSRSPQNPRTRMCALFLARRCRVASSLPSRALLHWAGGHRPHYSSERVIKFLTVRNLLMACREGSYRRQKRGHACIRCCVVTLISLTPESRTVVTCANFQASAALF
jgi:hypothetical protein